MYIEAGESCRSRFLAAWNDRARGLGLVLRRASERGEIPAGVDVDLLAEVGLAVLAMRALVSGEPVDDADLVGLVDRVLIPAAHAPPSS